MPLRFGGFNYYLRDRRAFVTGFVLECAILELIFASVTSAARSSRRRELVCCPRRRSDPTVWRKLLNLPRSLPRQRHLAFFKGQGRMVQVCWKNRTRPRRISIGTSCGSVPHFKCRPSYFRRATLAWRLAVSEVMLNGRHCLSRYGAKSFGRERGFCGVRVYGGQSREVVDTRRGVILHPTSEDLVAEQIQQVQDAKGEWTSFSIKVAADRRRCAETRRPEWKPTATSCRWLPGIAAGG